MSYLAKLSRMTCLMGFAYIAIILLAHYRGNDDAVFTVGVMSWAGMSLTAAYVHLNECHSAKEEESND